MSMIIAAMPAHNVDEHIAKVVFVRLFWARVLNFTANRGAKVKLSDSQNTFF